MSIKAINLRKGMGILYKNAIWTVVDNQKVAKGNWRSSQVLTLKNLKTGQQVEDRFRTDESFEQVITERKPMNYLYSKPDAHVFMDMETYEEVLVPLDLVETQSVYLTPNLEVTLGRRDDRPITIELPTSVILSVKDVPPGMKGATVTNVMKEALCEGGARIKVPTFIENGAKIKVDTRTGEYLERA